MRCRDGVPAKLPMLLAALGAFLPHRAGAHTLRHAELTDHIELEFDWDNQEMAMLGTPVVRNAPTKLGVIEFKQQTGEGALPYTMGWAWAITPTIVK